MIYWLLIFSFDINGDFVSKQELQLSSKYMCEMVAARVQTKSVKTLCVSDDHHSGRKLDDNIPLD